LPAWWADGEVDNFDDNWVEEDPPPKEKKKSKKDKKEKEKEKEKEKQEATVAEGIIEATAELKLNGGEGGP
jgi:hypothetical protein